MSSKQLFDNDSDSDENESGFKTNKDYAKSYNKFRSKELLKKVKDKAQSTGNKASNSSDDSSSDSDSTDNETVDPKFDEAFFQALATLKKKDSSTYDANVKFFEEFDGIKASGEKKSSKALTVKDYERKILLEKGGIYEDEEDDNGTDLRPPSPSYNQEQMNIKNAFKKVIEDDDDEDDNEWGGIFRKREKTKEEEATEEEQYIKWLTGQEANIGAKAQELKPLKEYWNSPKLSKDEKFLRDYILSNGYSKSDKDDVPTYDEIVGDDNLEISEDEAELERQAEFEHKFNFRFEEPDNEFIKRYPRTIEHSVRKQDNRRKEKRVEVKERKLNEKKEKMKELEMINAIRKREIEEKIKKLKEVTGEETIPFNDDDIDGDFDPDEYDRKMNEIFNNEYYQVDEGETKPDCPDIEDLKVDDWDNYDPSKDQADDNVNDGHCEDDDFVMDCDYDPEQQRKSLQDELIENSRDNRRRRKRRSKFVEMLKTEKPVFNPDDEKTYGEYLDEYYKLDYEDIIGDTPCRFKYVETVPNDFGLTVEEILLAKNKELNAWASLKKATQIRPDHVELNEVKTFKNKARNEYLKRKILPSLYGEGSDDDDDDDQEGKANVPAETTIPNRKRKISEEETKQEEPKKSDQETTAQKDKKKAKTKVAQPAIKVTGDSGKTSKKVIVKETPTVTVQPEAKSKIEKPTKQSVEKKQNILMPKKVSTAKLNVQKKQAASIPDPKRKANKRNTDSTLLKKGGITKKTVRPQHNKSATSTISNKPSISDERLRAFGLNPKKFHKKMKYGNKSTGSATSTSSSKKVVTKNNKLDKMNQKKIKKKLLKVLGS